MSGLVTESTSGQNRAKRHISLQIVAKTATDDHWVIDVIEDGTLFLQDVHVTDPLTPDQTSTCRWYLEQYVQSSPFAGGKAREAEMHLKEYPLRLLSQLPLRRILRPHLEVAAYQLADSVLLSIEVIEDEEGRSANSIHGLLWETLEDSELWDHPSWEVVVHRSIKPCTSDAGSNPHRISPFKCGNGKSEFNVLLVVARDLTHNPSLYSDVDASVATNALLQIQKGLGETNGKIQLNVEIVRPGTLAAFREHLQRAGNGYFHLVHFDMHGRVGLRKGTASKAAFLYFSDPKSQETRPVPGHSVASILGKHNVPFAVLNSCESARASTADDANIAAQFLKHGVRGTIGMPFKIASSAAAIFLEHFYRALLLGHVSFPVAAAAGRKALRLRPIRPTRYGLQLPLRDHFVAVAYGCHGILDYPTLASTVFHTAQRLSPVPPFPPKDSPIGREFDVLRLEKLLVQNRIVYLSGVYGVGKTAFLDYAALMWKSTHFVDAAVSVNFGMQEGLSPHGFSMNILQQLCSQVKSVPAVSARSDDVNTINETIESILSKINAVVFVEGLETAPIYPIPDCLGAEWTAEIAPCLRMLLRIAKDTSRTGRCYVVFAHRRLNPHPDLEDLVGHQFRASQYNLSGLDMPDALDLSYKILQASGEDTQQWRGPPMASERHPAIGKCSLSFVRRLAAPATAQNTMAVVLLSFASGSFYIETRPTASPSGGFQSSQGTRPFVWVHPPKSHILALPVQQLLA
ncbi:hypothetical protein GE09DRAFT_556579 [Coniochaeta sp. 2T2.1]|nr:hypothetical protein GE09DRAFT_556579 [Coniochaeta sp. 2T2.1]